MIAPVAIIGSAFRQIIALLSQAGSTLNLSGECLRLINYFNTSETSEILARLVKKIFQSGLSSNQIDEEEKCIQEGDVYILLSGKYNTSYSEYFKNENVTISYNKQQKLFLEQKYFIKELCLFIECKDTYPMLFLEENKDQQLTISL